ncbi:MAG TPA: YgjP-like metallopeptidase domain-containing protein, partial [Caulobacteraceae bacterium]
RPRLTGGILNGCGRGEIDGQLVIRAIRRVAMARFQELAAARCASLGKEMPALSLTDARSRWGSCTPPTRGRPGSIRLSWRLALAPLEVADYVVAHECAHLVEPNHGPRFWALVRDLVGDPTPHRDFLRREGVALHGFGRANGNVL